MPSSSAEILNWANQNIELDFQNIIQQWTLANIVPVHKKGRKLTANFSFKLDYENNQMTYPRCELMVNFEAPLCGNQRG